MIFLAGSLLGNTGPTLAYDPVTHQDMSEKAFNASALVTDPTILENLGLPPLARKQTFSNSEPFPSQREIFGLFRDGADFEDANTRAMNHFFNPLTGKGLTVGGNTYSASPDWAIDGKGDPSTVQFSFKAARQYLWEAVANGSNSYAYRQKQFGLMFETLGHVIHHLQDMAQPQHVRDEMHCDLLPCEIVGLYNPSLYESFTKDEGQAAGHLTYGGYDPVYSSADPATFNTPRNFWTTTTNANTGKGIAEYTNRGFVSKMTNFDNAVFSSPQLDPANIIPTDIGSLCAWEAASAHTPCPPGLNLSGTMLMIANTVTDNYRESQKAVNPFASTASIYDEDLKDAGKGAIFSLNRFNFNTAQDLLIPRAVGYSAGLINYFFRGKMQISLPDEGVYGIVDHSVEKTIDVSGFRTIKLKLANMTPGEAMGAGELVAVAKFGLGRACA